MPPSSQNRHASRSLARQRDMRRFGRQNSAVTAKWRWTCSHIADAAPEWPALLAATTTATPLLLPDGGTLFHVSLTLREKF